MKRQFLSVVRCPVCAGSLGVFAGAETIERNNEIVKCVLTCSGCARRYEVRNYIPRLVESYNYSHSWGTLWRETGKILRDSFTGMPWHYNVIHGAYDESGRALADTSPFGFEWPTDLSGSRVLEIGPGTGNCTEHLVKTNAELTCIDMSDAVDTFPESLLTRPNLNVVQADINSNALPEGYFNRIWFFQVLQHTPRPRATLARVRRYLIPGGELSVTSYGGEFHPWYYGATRRISGKVSWRMISFFVPPLVYLKYKISKALRVLHARFLERVVQHVMAPIDPRNVYASVLDGRLDDWLQGAMWRKTGDRKLLMQYVIVNTFDAVTPSYTNCCRDNSTMEQWLRSAGYSAAKVWGKNGVRAKAIR